MATTATAPLLAAPIPQAAWELLAAAHRGLAAATTAERNTERYGQAHLAALRGAAAILAARARPLDNRRRIRKVWDVLPTVAPEFSEWAAYFAAGASKRAAADAGSPQAVTARETDDLLRAVDTFLRLAEGCLTP